MSELEPHHQTWLNELDEALGEVEPSPDLRARLVRDWAQRPSPRPPSVSATPPREPSRRHAAVLAVAAGVLAVVAFGVGRRSAVAPYAAVEPALSAVGVPSADAEATVDDCARSIDGPQLPSGASGRIDGRVLLAPGCVHRLAEPDVTVTAVDETSLRQDGATFSFERGWAVFDVEPVGEGPPVHVQVGPVDVEVVGTRFSIFGGDDGGHLDLVEGHVRVRSGEQLQELAAGQRADWSRSRLSTPASPVPPPRPSLATDEPADAESGLGEALAEITRLRRAGRYPEALARIRQTAASAQGRTAEVLHYEEGTLLEGPLSRPQAACRHWGEHLRRFESSRYAKDVRRRLNALSCPGE